MKRKRLRKKIFLAMMSSALMLTSSYTALAADTNSAEETGTRPANAAERSAGTYELGEYRVPALALTSAREKAPAFPGGQVNRTAQLGALGTKDVMEVPFNIVSYTAEFIENKQAATVTDLIINDPSVSDQTLSAASSAWSIRGFKTTQQDVQFNGLYGIAPRFYTGIEGLERVEVLKGPSALLSGMSPNGTVGGTVNFIPKRAAQEPLNRVTLTYGDGHQFTQYLDFGRRTEDGKVGVRINVLNRNGKTSNDNEKNEASTVTVGLDAKGDRYRLSLDLGYAYNNIENPQYRVTFGNAFLNSATSMLRVPRDSKFGSDGTYRRITEKYGVLHGEYDFNDNWTAYGSFGMRSTSMDYLYNEFQLQNASGYSRVRYRYNNQVNKGDSAELGVKGKLQTGDLNHEITIGASRVHYTRYMYNRILNSYFTSLYSPQWGTPTGDLTWRVPKNDETTLTGIAITDVISTPNDKWQFVVGGRFQRAKVENFNTSTGNTTSSYDKTAFSPSFGILHKMSDRVSLYANYMQGLEAGSVVTDTTASNYGEVFAPYKTKQYEVGMKADLGKYAATLSAFSIKRPSLIQDASTSAYGLNGLVRHRGIELNVFGEPRKGTRVLGGMTFLDAKYVNTDSGLYDGNRVAGIPRFTAVLGVEQDIAGVEGLSLSTRMVYNSSAYINEANTFRVSPWVRWDMGARYSFKAGHTPMTVRADVLNVLNRNYWHALENAVYLGNSRTVMVSLSADF